MSTTGTLVTILWRDIPAQVLARRGRDRHTVPMPARFQVAIDRAAMAAGVIGTDDYLEQWRRESRACDGDLAGAAAAAADEIEAAFPPDVLDRHVDNFGWAPGREEPPS